MVIFDPKMTQKSSFFAEKCQKSITNLTNVRFQRPGLVSDPGFTSMAREARRRTGQLDAGAHFWSPGPDSDPGLTTWRAKRAGGPASLTPGPLAGFC